MQNRLASIIALLTVARVSAAPVPLGAQCSAASPQKAHILFDNSVSLRDSLPDYADQVEGWFLRFFSTLRPADSLYVHPYLQLGEGTIRTVARLEIPAPPAGLGASETRRITRSLSIGPTSDLTASMRKLRESLPSLRAGCPRMLFVVTDASLAPMGPGSTRNAAFRELQGEVNRWEGDGAYVLAVLAGPGTAPAFDPQYRWVRSAQIGDDRRWHGVLGSELLADAFDTYVAWDKLDGLARHLYFDLRSPLGGPWTGRATRAPNLRGMNAKYLLYRLDTPSERGGEYTSCAPAAIRDPTTHYITVAGTSHDWCYHHVIDPPDELQRRIADSGADFAWIAQPQLDLSGLPDPLLSSGQILVSDLEEAKFRPGCQTEVVRRYLAQGGWTPDGRSRVLHLSITDTANPQNHALLNLRQIPSTACYTGVRVAPGAGDLPSAERIQVEAYFAEGADTTRSVVTRTRSTAGPKWIEVQARHILSLKPFRTSVWLVSGRMILPRSHPWKQVLIGSTTALLDSADQRDCGTGVGHDRCFSFKIVAAEAPPARAQLLASDEDKDAIPVDVDARWNSWGFVMPWLWAGGLLLIALIGSLAYCWYKHSAWVADAFTRDRRRGYKEFWLDSFYYGFLSFFVLFMVVEAVEICRQADRQSSSVVLAAFTAALTSIILPQLPRIFARRSSGEER
ncbi:MAG TPA: hypothetical protein VGB66_16415 [Longimicrobium sp.]|jgi:hypothetical protein